jgi:hypothetical protein
MDEFRRKDNRRKDGEVVVPFVAAAGNKIKPMIGVYELFFSLRTMAVSGKSSFFVFGHKPQCPATGQSPSNA